MTQTRETTDKHFALLRQLRWLAMFIAPCLVALTLGAIFLAFTNLQAQQEHPALIEASSARPDADSPAQVAIRETSTGPPLPPERYQLAIALLAITGIALVSSFVVYLKDRTAAKPTADVLLLSGSLMFGVAGWVLYDEWRSTTVTLAVMGVLIGASMIFLRTGIPRL